MLIIYLAFSVLGLIILVHLATCKGYFNIIFTYSDISALSPSRFHKLGKDKPVSDSFIPHN